MGGLKGKKTRGRVKVLLATLYKGHKVIIRMIGKDYFEYITECNGEIYSSYIIIKPREGKKKLSKTEISECTYLIYSGAEATLDALLGRELTDEEKALEKALETIEEKK